MIAVEFFTAEAKGAKFLTSRKPVIQSEGSIAREGEESPSNEMLQLDDKITKQ